MSAIRKKLIGQMLEGGWTIVSERRPPPTASGGCFSYGFVARGSDGQEVFVKVLDIRLNSAHADPLKDLEIRIQRFNYEAEIARACGAPDLSSNAVQASPLESPQPINTGIWFTVNGLLLSTPVTRKRVGTEHAVGTIAGTRTTGGYGFGGDRLSDRSTNTQRKTERAAPTSFETAVACIC